ncbi:DUF6020 family protein [Streptacidiphilus cavernicola]|uniref:DUF6020 family protein n=1 Tax=Streptacidiphilus cavernicola TaxID=3342716 RepID=A0ABV6VZ31_9ACTN
MSPVSTSVSHPASGPEPEPQAAAAAPGAVRDGSLRGRAGAALRRVTGRIPPRLRFPLGVALLTQAVLLVWWAAFYPGLMSYDTIAYTFETTSGHPWVDDHSIAYDSAVWLSLTVTGDYALLTFAQVLVAGAIVGYLAAGLRKFAVGPRWIVAGALLFAVLPTTGAFTVWVWKDVPFVLGASLCFAALVHLTADALRGPRHTRLTGQRRDWLLLSLALLLTCLARNNGFLTALIAGAVLLFPLRRAWRRILVAVLVPVVLFFGLDLGLYPALGVVKPANYAGNTFFYADIAYVYSKAPGTFTPADTALMAKVAPLKHWSSTGADCYDTDYLTSGGFSQSAANRLNRPLVRLFLRTVKRSPDVVLDATLCRAHPAWAVFPGADPISVPGTGWSPDLYGYARSQPAMYTSKYYPVMRPHSLFAPLHGAARFWYSLLTVPQLRWLLWGGAVWCYVAYLLVLRLAWRLRRTDVLALAVATAAFQLTVVVGSPSPLYRYMAGPTLVGVLALPLLFSRLGRGADAEADSGADAGAGHEPG